MNLRAFFAAPSGRLLAATAGFALAAAGALALIGSQPPLWLLPTIMMLLVVSAIFIIGLAADRFWLEALVLVLGLPVAGGLYFAGATQIGEFGLAVAVPLFALAQLPTWMAIGYRYTPPRGRAGNRPAATRPVTTPDRRPLSELQVSR